jgi:hypothetical protein
MNTESVTKPLPFAGSLGEFANISCYHETSGGMAKYKTLRMAEKISSFLFTTIFVLTILVGVLVYLGLPYHKLSNAIILAIMTAVVGSIILWLYKVTYLNICRRTYASGCWNYAENVAKKISGMFGTFYYIFANYNVLFYDDNMCCYVDAVNGQTYAFDKSLIKYVALEHVHLGSTITTNSTTTGTATAWSENYATVNAKTKTVTHAKSEYEWRLDILSNFQPCPNITVRFPEHDEDSAKKAYSLLMKRY